MIRVHHLNASRSMRILWLLEELGLDYEVVKYQRDPETNLAPPEMRCVSPLGKSPTIEDTENGGKIVFESGAIVEYLIRNYDTSGRLRVEPSDPGYDDYVFWMHYAEGSAMLPVMISLYASRLGEAAAPLRPRLASEIRNHFGYISRRLEGRDFLVSDRLTGADVQMVFVIAGAYQLKLLEDPENPGDYDGLGQYIKGIHARPAYEKAVERSGESRKTN